jgi:hypothetical protein
MHRDQIFQPFPRLRAIENAKGNANSDDFGCIKPEGG